MGVNTMVSKGLSTMISKHNVAKQQKQDEEMRNRMATLRKKLVTSPSYKKLNSKDGDIPYAVNTEIMKQEVRNKTSELAQKAFWFSEKNAIIQEVKANNILLYFPMYNSFEKDKIKNWRRLEDAVFDPNNWLMLNAVKDTDEYKHLIGSRDHIKFLASYFSNVLQIKPPIVGALRAARDMKKGALATAKNLAQRARDKVDDKRVGAKDKFKKLVGRADGKEKERAKILMNWCAKLRTFPAQWQTVYSAVVGYLKDCNESLVDDTTIKQRFKEEFKDKWDKSISPEFRVWLGGPVLPRNLETFRNTCKYPHKNRENIYEVLKNIKEKQIPDRKNQALEFDNGLKELLDDTYKFALEHRQNNPSRHIKKPPNVHDFCANLLTALHESETDLNELNFDH